MVKQIFIEEYNNIMYRIICNFKLENVDKIFIFEKSTDKDALGEWNWEQIPFLPFIMPIKDRPDYRRIHKIMSVLNEAQEKFLSIKDFEILE